MAEILQPRERHGFPTYVVGKPTLFFPRNQRKARKEYEQQLRVSAPLREKIRTKVWKKVFSENSKNLCIFVTFL
jgi:hypothetical protein